jgi:hypothetical protein
LAYYIIFLRSCFISPLSRLLSKRFAFTALLTLVGLRGFTVLNPKRINKNHNEIVIRIDLIVKTT